MNRGQPKPEDLEFGRKKKFSALASNVLDRNLTTNMEVQSGSQVPRQLVSELALAVHQVKSEMAKD
jgi:hypothetical protein